MINTVKNEENEGYKYFEGYVNMTKVRTDFMSKNPGKLTKRAKDIRELLTSAGYRKEFEKINKEDTGAGIPAPASYSIIIEGGDIKQE